ncbi:PspC domain-containing protein [Corynebacterium sp. HMSC04H06]|uniref:PspC domain-containing protein n=1 Tax=Corynebacterium sp. HMSC04H06 TaxID=1581050 RepID=UPI0008A5F459|nr:PspC domain-containing protein [Corynebacterium sp. HMSC04H06]OFS20376.1 PspC family transcriptional regulator [Corynebacterium sp. HMSC04H06]
MNEKLHRSSTDCYIAGVCGGIAETYNVDATLVRALFAIVTLAGASGLAIYIVLWICMPEGPQA